jgi:hypothetical protein
MPWPELKVDSPQPGHGQAGGHRGGGVLALGLDEDQRPVGDVEVPRRRGLGPVFAHLRRRRDRVGTGGVDASRSHMMTAELPSSAARTPGYLINCSALVISSLRA